MRFDSLEFRAPKPVFPPDGSGLPVPVATGSRGDLRLLAGLDRTRSGVIDRGVLNSDLQKQL